MVLKTVQFSTVLISGALVEELSAVLEIVAGFVDTLVFKKEFPQRKSYTQVTLMTELMNETYHAHNALDDVKALQKMTELIKHVLPKNIFGSQVNLNSINAGTYQNTLKPLEDSKAISKLMAMKIARSGLNYEHLKVAFERNGFDGLMGVLGEKVEGTV